MTTYLQTTDGRNVALESCISKGKYAVIKKHIHENWTIVTRHRTEDAAINQMELTLANSDHPTLVEVVELIPEPKNINQVELTRSDSDRTGRRYWTATTLTDRGMDSFTSPQRAEALSWAKRNRTTTVAKSTIVAAIDRYRNERCFFVQINENQ